MRKRNDLYYIERINTQVAIMGSGGVSDIEEVEKKGVITVKGRRPDRPRKLEHSFTVLAERNGFDSPSDLLIQRRADKQVVSRFYMYDDDSSWTLADMPDSVINAYEAWDSKIQTPSINDIVQSANVILDANRDSGEDIENATIPCPQCFKSDPKYACRVCGYARNYFKYPIVRLIERDGSNQYDQPFNAAAYLRANPDKLAFRTEQHFNREGKMTAIKYALLDTDEVDAEFIGHSGTRVRFDEADDIAGGVAIPIGVWYEDSKMPKIPIDRHGTFDYKGVGDTGNLIHEFQRLVSVEIERESTDTEHYQKVYDRFVTGVRTLGKGVLDAVIRSKYEGMGETGYEMLLAELPFVPTHSKQIAYDSSIRWLLEKAVKRFDFDNDRIDLRDEGGY